MKTKVQFLIHGKGKDKDLFAYFPGLTVGTMYNTSYSHIGQHAACSPIYARESREATKKEYSCLLTELISIGYDLEILNK